MMRAHLPTAAAALKELQPYCDEMVRVLDRGFQAASDKFALDPRPPCRKTFAGVMRSHTIGELEHAWSKPPGPTLRVLDNDGIEVRIGRYVLKVRLCGDGVIPTFPMSRPTRAFFRQLPLVEFSVEEQKGLQLNGVEMLAPINLVMAWDIDRKKRILRCWLICPEKDWRLDSIAWSEELALIFVVDPAITAPTSITDADDDLGYLELNDTPSEATGTDDDGDNPETDAGA